MIFSISEYLGFSDEEILKILAEEEIEVEAVREPTETQTRLSVAQQ